MKESRHITQQQTAADMSRMSTQDCVTHFSSFEHDTTHRINLSYWPERARPDPDYQLRDNHQVARRVPHVGPRALRQHHRHQVQYSTVQYSTVQYSTGHSSTHTWWSAWPGQTPRPPPRCSRGTCSPQPGSASPAIVGVMHSNIVKYKKFSLLYRTFFCQAYLLQDQTLVGYKYLHLRFL